jgi:dipeptide/tripeptide permease
MSEQVSTEKKVHPLREIVQPFIDLVHAPRALWGINVSYFFEGFVYFGMLGYLAMYFNEYVGLNDMYAGMMVGVLTWGITFSMFLFGGMADRWGARRALLVALCMMLVGRVIMAAGPSLGGQGAGLWSVVHLLALLGILFIVLGYGMYQPSAYTAVRQLTTPATAGMGYAMLYAVMNLGGWLPSFFTSIRKAVGIDGAYWIYAGLTTVGLILTAIILSKKTYEKAMADVKAAAAKDGGVQADAAKAEVKPVGPFSLLDWLKNHPLADWKFSLFIFALIPVQTLFAHNWLTIPMYVERAYAGTWLGDHFEFASNLNPIMIFILVPIVAALTYKNKVYNMMILGTFVMAAPTFLLALGPSPWTLGGFLLIMTIGEAMWQPRFLQFAAEIAPEGRTGAYMGVAQFPWFLTKVITSLYSGWFLMHYCPKEGVPHTEQMWFIYGCIAMITPVMLVLLYGVLGKNFRTKHAG